MNSLLTEKVGIEGLDFDRILEMNKGKVSPYALFANIKNFFRSTESGGVLPFHKNLAEIVLRREYGEKPFDHVCLDLLCEELRSALISIGEKIFAIDVKMAGNFFNKRGVFRAVEEYVGFIRRKGKSGKKYAEKVEKQSRGAVPCFWFLMDSSVGEDFFHSPAFLGLTRVLWEDQVKERVEFHLKFPPNTTSSTFTTLTSLLSAKAEKSTNPDVMLMVSEKQVVGRVDFSCVPLVHCRKLFKGVGKLNTVTGHKFIRYAVSLPFEQKLRGRADFKVKDYDGGVAQLGQEFGIKQKKTLSDLSSIVWALSYLQVKTPQFKYVRLIEARNFISSKTGRRDGLSLRVLPWLVGYGEVDSLGHLLIPMATLNPPVKGIAPTQYHAFLFHLQMLLMREFSRKSKEFFRLGDVEISLEEWEILLKEAKIPLSYRDRVLSGWTVDCVDAPMIIKRKKNGFFSLGSAYYKISRFLKDQGKIRIKQSERAKKRKKTEIFQ